MPRLRTVPGLVLALLSLPWLASSGAAAPAVPPAPSVSADLTRLLDDYWQLRLEDDLAARQQLGLPLTRLPDASAADAERRAAAAAALLTRMERLDPRGLSHEESLSLEVARWECRQAVAVRDHVWLLALPTMSRLQLRGVHTALAALPLQGKADLDAYLALVRQVPGLVRQIRATLDVQRSKGLLPPKDMIDMVVTSLRSFIRPPAEGPYGVADGRLEGPRREGADVAAFQAALGQLVTAEINPALEDLAAALEAAKPAAPQQPGLGRYPGGEEAYRALVRYHTSLDVTPEEVHRLGLEEVARIDARMAEVRAQLGFQGTKEEFHRLLRTDPRFLAKTPEEVAERLMRPVHRLEPLIERAFLRLPKAPYGVHRLDPALEATTFTFGYYQQPTPKDPAGTYFFNGSQLDQRPLANAAALIYHELIPGHHFQISLQLENESLPAFRRLGTQTAFVEGWAEYASALGVEMAIPRDELYEIYGRLSMDMFLSVRLVVDTGLNHLGWTREQAIAYMLDHVLESETQIRSETLRYGSDRPGQALAYRMGALKILELRHRAERELGTRFDLRRFHDAVLTPGSLPLAVLEQHITWWIGEEKKRDGGSR